MSVSEGVIQFGFSLREASPPFTSGAAFAELRSWRRILQRLSLLGQSPDHYDGLGYGNLSMRLSSMGSGFLVSATQTSGLEQTAAADWVFIDTVDMTTFQVNATGLKPPSSEAITHAMIYTADASIRYVLHGHSPDIWHQAKMLNLPSTGPGVSYGSPALAGEVARLLVHNPVRPLVFTTRGHEDGVFSCGADLATTASTLIATLAAASALTP